MDEEENTEVTETEEPKTFTQEQVGSLLSAEREKVNTRNAAAMEAQRSSMQTQFDEQGKKIAGMEEAFTDIQRRRAEEMDERTPDEKMADELTDMRGRLAASDKREAERAEKERVDREDSDKVQGVVATYQRSQAAFDKPDYQDAVNHIVKHRTTEMTDILGMSDAREIENQIRSEHFALVKKAIDANKDPAAIVYQYAVLNGYSKPNGEDKDEDKGPKAVDVVRSRAEGQNMVDIGGGKSPESKMTLEKYAKASKEDRDVWFKADPEMVNRLRQEDAAKHHRR